MQHEHAQHGGVRVRLDGDPGEHEDIPRGAGDVEASVLGRLGQLHQTAEVAISLQHEGTKCEAPPWDFADGWQVPLTELLHWY